VEESGERTFPWCTIGMYDIALYDGKEWLQIKATLKSGEGDVVGHSQTRHYYIGTH
jgi:hypothetical protein